MHERCLTGSKTATEQSDTVFWPNNQLLQFIADCYTFCEQVVQSGSLGPLIIPFIHRLTREGVETNLAQAYMAKRRSGRLIALPLTHSLQKTQRHTSNVHPVMSAISFC